MAEDVIGVTLMVTSALDACGVPYTVGGSLASSLSGEPRFTQDADILVSLEGRQIAPLVEALGPAFYADVDAIGRAVTHRSSVNLIHIPSNIKIDLFIAGGAALDGEQLRRRQQRQVASDPDRFAYFHSHEDIVLQKLLWYQAGGEVSDRQWRDALGIVLKQGRGLDQDYLKTTAEAHGLAGLLERLLRDSD